VLSISSFRVLRVLRVRISLALAVNAPKVTHPDSM
jgi:hypothetical protein